MDQTILTSPDPHGARFNWAVGRFDQARDAQFPELNGTDKPNECSHLVM